MKKTYIIAEIGINHNGCLNTAKRLIDISAAAGCDAVKFQKRNPDLCVPEKEKNIKRVTPWGNISYIDYKHKIEFGREEYDEIDRYCYTQGIQWTASPWDLDSVEFLSKYDLPFIKIASASLTDKELLKECVARFPKVIMSTGMSTSKQIADAVKILNRYKDLYSKKERFGLLHCNSSYPAPLEDLNLSTIKTLAKKYPDYDIGYSGHELTLGTTVASVLLGASIIERHVTIDRNMWGTDQSCSVTPWGLFKLVSGIRELEKAYGDGKIKVTKKEKEVLAKLRKV